MRADNKSLEHIAAVLSVGKSTVACALAKADETTTVDRSSRAS